MRVQGQEESKAAGEEYRSRRRVQQQEESTGAGGEYRGRRRVQGQENRKLDRNTNFTRKSRYQFTQFSSR